jgi:hypothetical protein
MKKSFKILAITLICGLLLSAILATVIWFQRNAIKQYAITQLNEQLAAPLVVSSIGISFIEQFPKVSVLFNNVELKDPVRAKQTLFRAQRVFVAFNIYDILTQNYHIKLIEADSGQCNIFIDAKGKANYNIFKPSDKPEEDVFLKLSEIKLRNIYINYQDLESDFALKADAIDAKLSGDFKGKKETFALAGNLMIHKMVSGSVTMLKNKQVSIDAALDIDEQNNTYAFAKSSLKLGTLALTCSGSIGNKPNYTLLDIEFAANEMGITDLLELLPGSVNKNMAQYKSTGSIYFNGSIKGKLSAKQNPLIKVQFGVENGTLNADNGNVKISDLLCKGEFSNGKSGKTSEAYLILPTLSFKLGDGAFNGALNIKNFSNPVIDLSMKGYAPINDILGFMQSEWIKQADGDVKLDISLSGNLKQLSNRSGFLECRTNGTVECNASNIVFKEGNKTIEQLNAKLRLEQKDLVIEMLSVNATKSDFKLSGTFKNMVPYLLADNQLLEADITYRSDYVDLENIVVPIPASKESEATAFVLPADIFVNANIVIGALDYHQFKAKNITGNIYWKGKNITAENVTAETFNGKIALSGQVENATDGRFLVSSNVQITDANISEMFRQCNNFGQEELTDKHLKGKLQATVDLAGVWSPKLECDLDKLSVLTNITIKQGELNNYKPLESLSKYIKLEDLRNLKFADLNNQIQIRKGIITIPEMTVNNNGLNISVAGTQTFAYYLDYHFKLKLNDLLAKKFKQRNSEFEEEEEENGMEIFISMKGPIDNLEFTRDKKRTREKVKENLKKEGKEVNKLWKKELGIEEDKTIKEKQTDSEELEFEAE